MKYRVVGDSYGGYEVQGKFWWWPFYFQLSRYGRGSGINTYSSLEDAKKLIELYKNKSIYYTDKD